MGSVEEEESQSQRLVTRRRASQRLGQDQPVPTLPLMFPSATVTAIGKMPRLGFGQCRSDSGISANPATAGRLSLPVLSLQSAFLVSRNACVEIGSEVRKLVRPIWLIFGTVPPVVDSVSKTLRS